MTIRFVTGLRGSICASPRRPRSGPSSTCPIPPSTSAPDNRSGCGGVVDDVPVELTLMPTKNGHVGPVKAAIRKALGKQAGDHVRVRLEAVHA